MRDLLSYKTSNGATAYRWVTKEIFNNMVRFGSSPSTPTTPPGANVVEPYVLKGRVTNSAGQPLAGVEVGARNTLIYNGNLITRTDSNGYYRIALNVNTTWKPWAYITKSYQGYSYRMDLFSDLSAFATQTAIRNFQWKIAGAHPEISDSWYGGTVEFHESWDSAATIDDWSRVRVTLTPIGPLLDGSTGKVITRNLSTTLELHDLPVGKYRITATYTRSNGTVVALKVADFRGSAPLASSVDMVLPPWNVLGGVIIVDVGF